MGKTAAFLDVMGARLDTRPAPIIYVGPSKEFNMDQFGPRFKELLEQSKSLAAKVSRARREKMTLWRVAGVRVRLAHGGSSTALKSDPAAIGLVDEYDEMLANVRGQGNVLGLLEARGFTYADFSTAVTSTCSKGVVDVARDDASGLEFWAKAAPEDLESPIWALWQEGTMHHWAWPCPHCERFFIPRARNLVYRAEWSAARVKRETMMQCPHCEKLIFDEFEGPEKGKTKARMNARGRYVAPGQWIVDGEVVGEPADTDTLSFWVSGLCSPFVSFGERAASLVEAEKMGDLGKVQTAKNAGYGELYAPGGGDVPEWQQILKLCGTYPAGELPEGAMVLTCAVDVQKNRLVYVIRAWGERATSWKVNSGELLGLTALPEVWEDLDELLQTRFGGLPIKIAFIDSGFRPEKPENLPINMVYEFCRTHSRFVFPTKGASRPQRTPLVKSKIEVNFKGAANKYGLDLFLLDTDHWKQWVHDRLRWDQDSPGAWFLNAGTTEDYARQIVSEVRTKGPSGKPVWVKRSRENHCLDCEAMNAAAGFLLNVQYRRSRAEKPEEPPAVAIVEIPRAPAAPAPPIPAKMPSPNATTNKFATLAAKMNP